MKKLFAFLLAVTMFASMTNLCYAVENVTTLSTTVPGATYTLNIPANQAIPFGQTEAEIGSLTVTNSSGFALGKNLSVTITYDAFSSPGVETNIPFTLAKYTPDAYGVAKHTIASGSSVIFTGKTNGSVKEKLTMRVVSGNMGNSSDQDVTGLMIISESEDWGMALAGEYTATITFKCEVVISQE